MLIYSLFSKLHNIISLENNIRVSLIQNIIKLFKNVNETLLNTNHKNEGTCSQLLTKYSITILNKNLFNLPLMRLLLLYSQSLGHSKWIHFFSLYK